jgi:hypothetical protein
MDKPDLPYPNSPAPPEKPAPKEAAAVPLSKLYESQGEHEEGAEVDNEYCLGFTEIELPRERLYGEKTVAVDRMHVRDLPLHIHKTLKDSLIRGGSSLGKTLRHYRGALKGSGLMGKDSLTEYTAISEKILRAQDHREAKRLLNEEMGPWLRGITIKRG